MYKNIQFVLYACIVSLQFIVTSALFELFLIFDFWFILSDLFMCFVLSLFFASICCVKLYKLYSSKWRIIIVTSFHLHFKIFGKAHVLKIILFKNILKNRIMFFNFYFNKPFQIYKINLFIKSIIKFCLIFLI